MLILKVYESYLANLNLYSICRIFILRLLNLKLNIKARQDVSGFLTANLLLLHIISLNIELSWNVSSLHNPPVINFLVNVDQAAHEPHKIEMWEHKFEN